MEQREIDAYGKAIRETADRHAPDGFDVTSDDLTVPFAIKLGEQDAELHRLRGALKAVERMLGLGMPSSALDFIKRTLET